MREFSLPIHLPLTERALIFVTLCPSVLASAIQHVSVELAFEGATVSEDCHTLPMLLVLDPASLVLSDHTIVVLLAREQLKSVTVADHLKLLKALLCRQCFDLALKGGRLSLDKLAVRLADISNFSIVNGTIFSVAKTLVVSCCISIRRTLASSRLLK